MGIWHCKSLTSLLPSILLSVHPLFWYINSLLFSLTSFMKDCIWWKLAYWCFKPQWDQSRYMCILPNWTRMLGASLWKNTGDLECMFRNVFKSVPRHTDFNWNSNSYCIAWKWYKCCLTSCPDSPTQIAALGSPSGSYTPQRGCGHKMSPLPSVLTSRTAWSVQNKASFPSRKNI